MVTLFVGAMLLATVLLLCCQWRFGAQYNNTHETSQTVEGTVEVCRCMTTTPIPVCSMLMVQQYHYPWGWQQGGWVWQFQCIYSPQPCSISKTFGLHLTRDNGHRRLMNQSVINLIIYYLKRLYCQDAEYFALLDWLQSQQESRHPH